MRLPVLTSDIWGTSTKDPDNDSTIMWAGATVKPNASFTIQNVTFAQGQITAGAYHIVDSWWTYKGTRLDTEVKYYSSVNPMPFDPNKPLFFEVATAVPEPLTILGSVAAMGFGAYAERKRKPSKSSKKDNTKGS